MDSRGAIRCMLGIDLAYTPPSKRKGAVDKSATVSVWRSAVEESEDGVLVGTCHRDVHAQFRDSNGEPCPRVLELTPADFLPPHALSHFDLSAIATISLPFADLASYITSSESEGEPFASPPPSRRPTHPSNRVLWRKRKRTPSEELSDSREDAFARAEQSESWRRRRGDGDWRPRSQRRKGGQEGMEREVVKTSA